MEVKARLARQPDFDLGRLVRGGVVHDHVQVQLSGGVCASIWRRKAMNPVCRCAGLQRLMIRPQATSRAAQSVVVPWRV